MSLVNPGLLQFAHVKDSRWLTLEVCREFQRNKCTRTETDCKYAHPPPHVEVQNGRVVCCYDSIKGKCQRKEPPCKYLHPPQHLREQLLQNGRNNLIIKNIQMQMLSQSLAASGQLLPLTAPFLGSSLSPAPAPSYAGYLTAGGLQLLGAADLMGAPPPPPPQQQQQQQHSLQSHSQANGGGGGGGGGGLVSVAGSIKMDNRECGGLPAGYPGSLPGGKRAAVADSKSGIPVYQPSAASFQQLAAYQSHNAGPYMPTSWTGDLFQEAACPTLTWV